ncbi:hypothetical protein UFOVP75_99 [uncultured Caudovirales phage]|uniref:Uncharacterized protein n=1 Tax=uncultured Caudovirales phage TaxID=2100421 RepID=A0A6J5L207_9CAUD|nr:hypothetical protein UFOVP75_99 [uncultured Caudovirales phage]
MNLTPIQQLAALQVLTERTQMLHDAQVYQLKLWPRVVFEQSTKSNFAVDFELHKIEFDVESVDDDSHQSRSELLNIYVKGLLGSKWTMVVRIAGKEFVHAPQHPSEDSPKSAAG